MPATRAESSRRRCRATGIALTAILMVLAVPACGQRPDGAVSTVIMNAVVIDGTGAPPRRAAVRIEADRITEVGEISPSYKDALVDADGLTLAPGFIDTHSHADGDIFEHRDALAAVSQGITTVIVGQDGGSPRPLSSFFSKLKETPAAINVASYAGHGTIRREVLGRDYRREATPEEIERMRELLREEMEAGALGLATGLEYEPGIHSTTEEVLELAREAASFGGRYISHVRSEDRWFWDAVKEIITIGREARLPVQISHIKLAMRENLGQVARLVGILDEARAAGVDVTADIYPYTYWHSSLTVLIPDRDYENRETATFALSEITTPEGAWLGEFRPNPDYIGKSIAEIAQIRGTDPVTTFMDLIREAEEYRERTGEEDVEGVIAKSMDEADIEQLMNWPHTNLCTDGALDGSHPRGFGSYPRVLGHYVRERRVMDLATAIHKSSGLAADHMGFTERGVIRPGMYADLVLFDPGTVIDRATPEEPHAPSVGIQRVWVNGEAVYEDGRTTENRPGRVLRRSL
jgi:N-acyl-D-amino-acid deacylase